MFASGGTEWVLFFVRTRSETSVEPSRVFVHFQIRHFSVMWLMPHEKVLDNTLP